MTATIFWLIIVLAILVILSGFFSASETAFTSLNHVRIKNLAKQKKSAARTMKLNDGYNKLLTSLLIGNNIVNITAASISTIIFTYFFGNIGITISTIFLTIMILIFSEITPKSIAKEKPEEIAMFFSLPLTLLTKILIPFIYIFDLWKKFIVRLFKIRKNKNTFSEEEFKIIVTDIKNEGVLNDTEHELIQKTLRYDDTLVSTSMMTIDKISAVEKNQDIQSILDLFFVTNYSRIPVYEGKKHNIIGLLYRADFYECMLKGCNQIESMIKPAIWTVTNKKVSAVLKDMQRRKQHMYIVGKNNIAEGLITMEDILEELVGEIDDEYDTNEINSFPTKQNR